MNDTTDTDTVLAAFEQLRGCCEAAWQVITEALQSFVRHVARVWSELQRMHLIPRQYRETIARRKIKRYALMCAKP